MSAPLRLGTRRSTLATAQSGQVADAVRAALGREVELVPVVTEGDRSTESLAQIGGTGVFVTALREALLDGRVDLAVHSLKDLPTAPADGLVLAAVPLREDPRDVLVCPAGLTLGELAPGARVGTGSLRRAAQLHALGLGLDIVPVRGNVDTRIKKAIDGDLDAVVLARAGLARLDRLDAVTEVLDPVQMLPAPGQGALAVECRDPTLAADLAVLDDRPSRIAVLAERALLAALEAGCSAPVGALADVAEADPDEPGRADLPDHPAATLEIYLRAVVAAVDGSDSVRLSATGPGTDPVGLGHRLAADLLAAGAATLMGNP
jgi:hydroxymethylbilane synthase